MPFTTPPTFTSGAILTAAQQNIISDDLNYLYQQSTQVGTSGTQVNRSAATSIPNAAFTAITWSGEVFDIGAWWTSGTNVVVPASAVPSGYTTIMLLVVGRTQFAANANGVRKIRFLKNGSSFGSISFGAISGDPTNIALTDFTTAIAGDIITMEVYQNSTAALDVSDTQISVMRYSVVS